MDEKSKTQDLIHKHGVLTPKQVRKRFAEVRKIKKTLTTKASELEKNLIAFNKITDPLVDPETNKPLCWIRRPTTTELEALMPTELMQYQNSPENVPQDVMEKYKDFQFKMMANLIENPKKSANWWKEHANLVFQQLFQIHLRCIMEDLGLSAENF